MKLRIYLAQSCFCLYHDFIKVILEKVIGRVTIQYCEIPRTKRVDHSFRLVFNCTSKVTGTGRVREYLFSLKNYTECC